MNFEDSTRAFGGMSILHTSGCGWGCTIPLELTCEAYVSDSWPDISQDPHMLLKQLRPSLTDVTGFDVGDSFFYRINSNIPPSMGLKSSSAASVSAVRLAATVHNISLSKLEIIKIATQMQLRAGCSMTGSYDDTWAALGKMAAVIRADSANPAEPVASVDIDSSMCTILLRGTRKSTPEKSDFRANRSKFKTARDNLMSGDIRGAIRENAYAVALSTGDGLATEIIHRLHSLDYNANISGSGPAIAVLHEQEQESHLSDVLGTYGRIITTKIVHDPYQMEELNWA
ncbi:MAG: hypothetical protein CMB75_03430 [Euryarchaeota archaeon]|nr:hypothetical protein [Euryarchaeota archaeon]|tara:strand:- start:4501 stop:5358 length:858 start_codon:yes stop_codon:yes gene_type:complete